LKVYKKPILQSYSYLSLLAKNKLIHGPKKVLLMEKLLRFRNNVGRKEDES